MSGWHFLRHVMSRQISAEQSIAFPKRAIPQRLVTRIPNVLDLISEQDCEPRAAT